MTSKTFYEKVGRRYVHVREYDSDLMDAMPEGAHLVLVHPGGKSTRYNVDPNYAAMIAAGRIAEDTISRAVMKASDLRPRSAPITEEQKAAWEHLVAVFGESAKTLEWPSARETAEAAVAAMVQEAEQLMQHPTVKEAYDHFQLVCNLTKDHQ